MKDEIKEILDEIGYHQHIHEHLTLNPKELDILKDYIINIQEELENYKQISIRHYNRPYANKYLKQKRKELNNKNLIALDSEMVYKDYYNLQSRIDKAINKIQYIIDYGFDYDGFNNVKDLKGLIDMLVDYARQSKDILQGSDKK